MKKIIQTVSFLTLVFALAASATFAQDITRLQANVPFAFAIGDKSFDAGKYTMRLRPSPTGVMIVELRDQDNQIVYEGFALQNGDPGRDKAHFVFDKAGSIAKLSRVQTGRRGFSIPFSGVDEGVTLASKKSSKALKN